MFDPAGAYSIINDLGAHSRKLDRGLPANAACRPGYDAYPIAQPKPVWFVRIHECCSFSILPLSLANDGRGSVGVHRKASALPE